MNRHIIQSALFLLILPLCVAGCRRMEAPETGLPEPTDEVVETERTVITVGLPETRTSLGALENGQRNVYWSNGDRICANGVESDALSGLAEDAQSADFSFPGSLSAPYMLLYPASIYTDAAHVTLPAVQVWTEGSFAPGAFPMAAKVTSLSGSVVMEYLSSVLHIAVRAAANSSATLSSVVFRANGGEQVSGTFSIDYDNALLTPSSAPSEEDHALTMTVSEALSPTDALDLFIVVPAGTYSRGFTFTLLDSEGHVMQKKRSASTTLASGRVYNFSAVTFVASSSSELELPDVEEEDLILDPYNVTGLVQDSDGRSLADVVVSDGLQCVTTTTTGHFYMNVNTAASKFIFVSTPSGYMPSVEGGKPRFYKALSEITPSGGVYTCDFTLTPVANPDSFTLLVTADPQPRSSSWNVDNVAYRSTRACEALYQDLRETAATVSGRQVYGICLGDLVHEDMGLLDTYSNALGDLGYPTYNIIGNHDYDITKADDDAGAWKFESLFGPRNYSFNLGGIHFVVLDNLIMKREDGNLTAYDQGLTDEIWAWLQQDMAFVPKTSTVMVCAHSPMFKQSSGSERTNTARHGPDYGALFDKYAEVHAWAGHTHSTFNYIYPSSHRHKRVQVHTLARSTGELWTNEYLADGTPRGFTVVDVVDGEISWRFHPTKYLKSEFHGTHGQPSYTYCDWNYAGTSPKVAKMKDTGADLDESYQMHVFPPDAYGDGKLYVNVFLGDSRWGTPTLTTAGGAPVPMTHVETVDTSPEARIGYDRADKEIKSFYYANYSLLRSAGYDDFAPGVPLTMFCADAPASGTATVSVTDRFGQVWTRTVSW